MSKFVITQESFDVCFAAGVADAQSIAGQTALYELLAGLSGAVSDAAAAQWAEYREAFIMGQAHELVNEASAAKRWTRLIDAFDLVKPQSVAAAAKAAQRQRAKSKGELPSKAIVTNVVETVTVEKPVATETPKADKMMAESARVTACLELLKKFTPEMLIKAHGLLLDLDEHREADATV